MSLITTSGLTKRYGSVLAVSDLTVDVAGYGKGALSLVLAH